MEFLKERLELSHIVIVLYCRKPGMPQSLALYSSQILTALYNFDLLILWSKKKQKKKKKLYRVISWAQEEMPENCLEQIHTII